jgi:hypothetical protein
LLIVVVVVLVDVVVVFVLVVVVVDVDDDTGAASFMVLTHTFSYISTLLAIRSVPIPVHQGCQIFLETIGIPKRGKIYQIATKLPK